MVETDINQSNGINNEKRLKLRRMIDGILFWFNNGGAQKFDPTYVSVIDLKLKNDKPISDKQFAAIERIYKTWVK